MLKSIGKFMIRMFKALVIFTIFLWVAIYFFFKPNIGENLKSVDWLPKEAKNISFNKNPVQKAYEFEISESGFLKWAEDNNYTIHEVSDKEYVVTLYRYTYGYPNKSQDYNNTVVSKFNGYYYKYSNSNGNGGGRWIGYDKDIHKAYYFTSSH